MKKTATQTLFAHSLPLALVLLCASTVCIAETIAIPLGQQGKAWQVETPATGTTKGSVETKYGSPIEVLGPVGSPPITTWEYQQFSVYFEYDHVIHAVVKHDAATGQ